MSYTAARRISHVQHLPTWDLQDFRATAFNAQVPATLPFSTPDVPPACEKWFSHDTNTPRTSRLQTSFWSEHESTIVPLELTTTVDAGAKPDKQQFIRTSAPLKILLTYLNNPASPPSTHSETTTQSSTQAHSIYLAQCDLTTLPPSLQNDLPTPSLVTDAGKGDIYASSLWMGLPPTYTPLHRDPNPNLFLQLAGQKVVRLMPPEIGDAVFEEIATSASASSGSGSSSSSSRFRGEEMMVGPEKETLHRIVWESQVEGGEQRWVHDYMCEATLGRGEALFIPKGWWHSVRGVGQGVTASVNWWFR